MSEAWTKDQITGLRREWSGVAAGYGAGAVINDALDEIERLQERDHYREQMLREVAAFMDDGMDPPDWSWHETISARIRAELGDAK